MNIIIKWRKMKSKEMDKLTEELNDHLFQEFIFDGEDFRKAKYEFLGKVDQYYNEKNKK